MSPSHGAEEQETKVILLEKRKKINVDESLVLVVIAVKLYRWHSESKHSFMVRGRRQYFELQNLHFKNLIVKHQPTVTVFFFRKVINNDYFLNKIIK